MMSETDIGGFRKRYRTNPDGSVTMLKTRGGWPQFTTTGEKPPIPPKPLTKWVLQAFMAPSLIDSEGYYGYANVGGSYTLADFNPDGEYLFTDFRPRSLNQRVNNTSVLKGARDWVHWSTKNDASSPVVTFTPSDESQTERWIRNYFQGWSGAQASFPPIPAARWSNDFSAKAVFLDGEEIPHPFGSIGAAYRVDGEVFAIRISGSYASLHKLESSGWATVTDTTPIEQVAGPVVVNASGTEAAFACLMTFGGRVVTRLAKLTLPGLSFSTEECNFFIKQDPEDFVFEDYYEETVATNGFGYTLGDDTGNTNVYRAAISTKKDTYNDTLRQTKYLAAYDYVGDTLKKLYVIRRYESGSHYEVEFSGVSMTPESVQALFDENIALITQAAIDQGKTVLPHNVDAYASLVEGNAAAGLITGPVGVLLGQHLRYPGHNLATPGKRLTSVFPIDTATNTAYALTLAQVDEAHGAYQKASLHYQIDDGAVKPLRSWRKLTGFTNYSKIPVQTTFHVHKAKRTISVPAGGFTTVVVDLWRVSWGPTLSSYSTTNNTTEPDQTDGVAQGSAVVGADIRHDVYVTRDFGTMATQVHFSPPEFPQAYEAATPVGSEVGLSVEAVPSMPVSFPTLTFMNYPFASIESLTVHPYGDDVAYSDSPQVAGGGMWYANRTSGPVRVDPPVAGARYYNPIYYRKSAE